MNEVKPLLGSGHFQWNAGGWFGSLFGGTAYLVAGSVFVISQNPFGAAVWLTLFAFGSLVGCYLWGRRATLDPYRAYQMVLAIMGCIAITAIVFAVSFAPEFLDGTEMTTATRWILMVLLFPSMMLWFHYLESKARQKQ